MENFTEPENHARHLVISCRFQIVNASLCCSDTVEFKQEDERWAKWDKADGERDDGRNTRGENEVII